MTDSITVFNRRAVRRHRARAAMGGKDDSDLLFRESAERLLDRLDDVTRSFPMALEFGCRTGRMGRALKERGIDTLVQCDLSEVMAARASAVRAASRRQTPAAKALKSAPWGTQPSPAASLMTAASW